MVKTAETERLLSTKQGALFLNCHPATLRRLVREKQIRVYRIGRGALRFRQSDLEAYLARIAEGPQ